MTNKTALVHGIDGVAYAVQLVDTSTTDDHGREIYKLGVDAAIEVGDIEIGAVEIKNSTDDTRATVGANGLYVDVKAMPAVSVTFPSSITADTELPAASALNGTIAKSVSAPMVGAGIMMNDGTNLIQAKAGAQGGVVIEGVASGTAVPISGSVTADTELAAAIDISGATIAKAATVPLVGAVNMHSDGTYLMETSLTNPLPVSLTRVVCTAADVNAPAVNTAAVVTYAADATKKHVITGVAWSYAGGTPVGGNLKIEDVVGTVIFTVDIDKSGPGGYEFPRSKIGAAANTAMVVTLAAGGAGVTGKVSVENHWLE